MHSSLKLDKPIPNKYTTLRQTLYRIRQNKKGSKNIH
jgi:hypothetical protein